MEPLNRRRHFLILLVIVPLAAGVASHLVFYRQFPWEASYRFPKPYFLTVATVMLACWTVNYRVFKALDRTFPFFHQPVRRIGRQFLVGGSATLVTFSIVFPVAIRLYSGAWPNHNQVISGVFVCLTIATIVNGAYVGLYLLQLLRDDRQATQNANRVVQALPLSEPASGRESIPLVIAAGARQHIFSLDELAYFYSSQGIVIAVKTDGRQIVTNYTSFTKLDPVLPEPFFFQLNRQYIATIQAVKLVEDDQNRKLRVRLSPSLKKNGEGDLVTVSRYRRAEFKRWVQRSASARPFIADSGTTH